MLRLSFARAPCGAAGLIKAAHIYLYIIKRAIVFLFSCRVRQTPRNSKGYPMLPLTSDTRVGIVFDIATVIDHFKLEHIFYCSRQAISSR